MSWREALGAKPPRGGDTLSSQFSISSQFPRAGSSGNCEDIGNKKATPLPPEALPPVVANVATPGEVLTPYHLDRIAAWLDREGAVNPATRDLFTATCRSDPAVLKDVLRLAPDPWDEPIEPREAIAPRRLWLIDGESHSFTPPATEAEVRDWYPGAAIEPEGETAPGGAALSPHHLAAVGAWLDSVGEDDQRTRAEVLALCGSDPEALAGLLAQAPAIDWYAAEERAAIREFDGGQSREVAEAAALVEVACAACRHWRADPTNPRGGLGSCAVDAPASRRAGSLWPRGTIYCRDWREVTP